MENLNELVPGDGNYFNEVVEKLETELGEFKYEIDNPNEKVEFRDAKILENGAKYHGQW